MQLVADAMFDLDALTFVGEGVPAGDVPQNSLLLQLSDGFYLFPPDERRMVDCPMANLVWQLVHLPRTRRMGPEGGKREKGGCR